MSDNWKEKYFQKLDQFEQSKKDWSGLEEFLRQTSSRLALAAEGGSKELDKKIYILRKAIRKGESQIKLTIIMDGVSAELIKLDKQSANKPKGHAGFLITLLDTLSVSNDMQKKSNPLRKLLNAKNPPKNEALVKAFSKFFDHCMSISYKNGESGNDENKGGFFSRLFSSNHLDESKVDPAEQENTEQQAILPSSSQDSSLQDSSLQDSPLQSNEQRKSIEKSVTESLHNILDSFIDSLDYPEEQKVLLREKLFAIKPTKEIHVLLGDLASMLRDSEESLDSDGNEASLKSDVHTILISLLETIPMQGIIQEQADELKRIFAKGISQKELPQALDSIAELILLMQQETSQGHKKFQKFLVDVSGKLQEFEQFLGTDLDEHKDSWAKSMALGNVVKEQVKGIGNSVSDGGDLKQLEKTIKNHLDTILVHVEDHRQNEGQRVKRIQKQNQLLKTKVNELESESSSLRNKIIRSQEKAYTDPLTQLPNRLSYNQHLEELFARWERYHENLLLIIWDIDFFKKVNDNHGHQAGDDVLKMVAGMLKKDLRKSDFIARFGGEEFVSLLPNTSLGEGFKVAEKMRSGIHDLNYKYKDKAVPLTISCGISLFSSGDKPDDVFERADKALYQAKKQGRNRCVIAQD